MYQVSQGRTREDEYRNRLQAQALSQYVLGQVVTAVRQGDVHTWSTKPNTNTDTKKEA